MRRDPTTSLRNNKGVGRLPTPLFLVEVFGRGSIGGRGGGIFYGAQFESGCEDAIADGIPQHRLGVAVGVALEESSQAPEGEPGDEGEIGERGINRIVMLEPEAPPRLIPIVGAALHLRALVLRFNSRRREREGE